MKINSEIKEELPHYQFLFSDFTFRFYHWTKIE